MSTPTLYKLGGVDSRAQRLFRRDLHFIRLNSDNEGRLRVDMRLNSENDGRPSVDSDN